LYVRLYGGAEPPGDDKLIREIQSYAQIRLPRQAEVAVPLAVAPAPADLHQPGIIEID
jgi:hypothetical protein